MNSNGDSAEAMMEAGAVAVAGGVTASRNACSSLHYAAGNSKKNVQMLQFLIDNYNGDIKTIINQKSNRESTPSFLGHYADVNAMIIQEATRKLGYTPLDYVYNYNKSPIKKDIISLLRKHGGKSRFTW